MIHVIRVRALCNTAIEHQATAWDIAFTCHQPPLLLSCVFRQPHRWFHTKKSWRAELYSVKPGNQFFDESVPKLVFSRKRWDNETGLDNHFPLEIELTANCVTSHPRRATSAQQMHATTSTSTNILLCRIWQPSNSPQCFLFHSRDGRSGHAALL